MLYLHLYGFLKKKFNPEAKLSEQTVVSITFKSNESFAELMKRIEIDINDLGDCFINGFVVLDRSQIIPDEARIGLFSQGMLLHEGGEFLKNRLYEEKNNRSIG